MQWAPTPRLLFVTRCTLRWSESDLQHGLRRRGRRWGAVPVTMSPADPPPPTATNARTPQPQQRPQTPQTARTAQTRIWEHQKTWASILKQLETARCIWRSLWDARGAAFGEVSSCTFLMCFVVDIWLFGTLGCIALSLALGIFFSESFASRIKEVFKYFSLFYVVVMQLVLKIVWILFVLVNPILILD